MVLVIPPKATLDELRALAKQVTANGEPVPEELIAHMRRLYVSDLKSAAEVLTRMLGAQAA